MNDIGRSQIPRLRRLATDVQQDASASTEDLLQHAFANGADAVWILDAKGNAPRGGVVCENQAEDRHGVICAQIGVLGKARECLPSGIEVWSAGGKNYFAARSSGGRGRKDCWLRLSRVTAPARTFSLELRKSSHRLANTTARNRISER